jgi:hypothetical protein
MLLKFLLSQSVYAPFALCVREAGQACQSRRVKVSFFQSTLSPPTRACHHHHSTRMSNDPPGEPPRSWSIVPKRGGGSNLDSVEQHPTAKERLPAQAKARTVEEQRSSRKCSTASQSSETRASTANSTQSTASVRSSRKRSMASQSSKTRAHTTKSTQSTTSARSSRKRSTASQSSKTRARTAKSTQSTTSARSSRKHSTVSQSSKTRAGTAKSTQITTPEHVERKSKSRRLLWKDPILVNVIPTSIGGAFQSIDGVERKLRTRNVAQHKVTPKTLESDPDSDKYLSVNPLAQDGQSRSDNKQNSNNTNRQTNHDSDNGQQALPTCDD